MSGFEPIIASGVDLLGNQMAANREAKYQQDLAQAQAASQLAQLQAQYAAGAESRNQKLKERLASQKASFAASGLETASGGSANAVLNGLVDSAAKEQAADDKIYGLRAASIGQNYDFARRRNLLEQSRQFSGASNGLGLISKGIGLSGGLIKSLL